MIAFGHLLIAFGTSKKILNMEAYDGARCIETAGSVFSDTAGRRRHATNEKDSTASSMLASMEAKSASM